TRVARRTGVGRAPVGPRTPVAPAGEVLGVRVVPHGHVRTAVRREVHAARAEVLVWHAARTPDDVDDHRGDVVEPRPGRGDPVTADGLAVDTSRAAVHELVVLDVLELLLV